MRYRQPDVILDRIRRNAGSGVDYYFFTDDNFARNPAWEPILDGLIEIRRKEAIDFQFMMQVDVLAYRIPGFVAKAAEAGCTQVFIGMETLNQDNLAAAGKRQNRVADYRTIIEKTPSDPYGYAKLGMALKERGDVAEAVGPLRTAVRMLPNDTPIRAAFIEALCATKDYAAAWDEVEEEDQHHR
jgi:radical SAM superfamily enzyme YgiQ (UPF0313 family)